MCINRKRLDSWCDWSLVDSGATVFGSGADHAGGSDCVKAHVPFEPVQSLCLHQGFGRGKNTCGKLNFRKRHEFTLLILQTFKHYGLEWSDLRMGGKGETVLLSLIFLAIDNLLYSLLAVYLDNVVPSWLKNG